MKNNVKADRWLPVRLKLLEWSYVFMSFLFNLRANLKPGVGVSKEKRDVRIIVSLTSIKERLSVIHICLESILSQKVKPDKVILWLSHEDNNGKRILEESLLPRKLLRLKKAGLEIRFCRNVRSYRKLFFTLKEYPNDIIITTDDDVIYPPDWLKNMLESYKKNPRCVHFYRGRLMKMTDEGKLGNYKTWELYDRTKEPSLLLIPTGKDGVLYPPGSLNEEVFNERAFNELCPYQDDIWFKAMTLLNNVLCQRVRPDHDDFKSIVGSQTTTLYRDNTANNDMAVRNVFEKYNLYRRLPAFGERLDKC